MVSKLVAITSTLLLGACGATTASIPNISNPAHCMAAFSYGRTIALSGRPSDVSLAVQSTARSIYESRKLKARGQYDSGQKDGEVLLAEHGKDDAVMMKLVRDCLTQQDADPEYRALNESGALMAAARKVDPACREDAICRSKMR